MNYVHIKYKCEMCGKDGEKYVPKGAHNILQRYTFCEYCGSRCNIIEV